MDLEPGSGFIGNSILIIFWQYRETIDSYETSFLSINEFLYRYRPMGNVGQMHDRSIYILACFQTQESRPASYRFYISI